MRFPIKKNTPAPLFILVALSFNSSAHGDNQTEASPDGGGLSVQHELLGENPLNFSTDKGTAELQLTVLKKINYELTNGALDPEEASAFKSEVDRLNDKESSYKSLGNSIPADVVEKNTRELNSIAAKLHFSPSLKTTLSKPIHDDTEVMINKALAEKRISSSEAAQYYFRLSQIESKMESAKSDKESGEYQTTAMYKSLAELKSEIIGRLSK